MNLSMTLKTSYPLLLLLLAGVFVMGCDSNGSDDDEPLEATLIEDIAADPTAGRDPNTGAPIQTGRYTLVSLRTGDVVLSYDDDNRADSASTAWDLGFQGTNIIVNGGTSGPGQGAALLMEALFDEVEEAPADSELRVDGTATCEDGPALAICPGSGSGWYNYNDANNVITPIPGRTLVVRTADGRYAKVRLLSYYEGNPSPDEITPTTPSRYYTLEYVFQDDGSHDLTSVVE